MLKKVVLLSIFVETMMCLFLGLCDRKTARFEIMSLLTFNQFNVSVQGEKILFS